MRLGPLLGMAIALTMLGAVPMMGKRPLLIWNASPSVPRGLYAVDGAPAKIGDLVLVRLPAQLATFAARRRYLPRDSLLIKPLVALAGDTVCRNGMRIYVRGRPVGRARAADAASRLLPSWRGCRTLQSEEMFLLSERPDGFDSRYFGAVSVQAVVGRAIRVWPLGATN